MNRNKTAGTQAQGQGQGQGQAQTQRQAQTQGRHRRSGRRRRRGRPGPGQAQEQARGQAQVTAAEWFAGGRRIPYDPQSGRVLTEHEAATAPDALRVFERTTAAERDADRVWLTLLPGFPDGSYGWAQVDRLLGNPGPRLYVEPVGQGDGGGGGGGGERGGGGRGGFGLERQGRGISGSPASWRWVPFRQRGGPLRTPPDPGGPRAGARRPCPHLPRGPPDHQRAPGPTRRRDSRHRGPPRRRRRGRHQPMS